MSKRSWTAVETLLTCQPLSRRKAVMAKAFSYIRLSSDRQAFGDGIRRQLKLTEDFANLHGLDLDSSMRDIGVSAFKGKNRLKGALAGFLDSVDIGEIPKGSYLIVESLDRLSRENVVDAQSLFLDIIRRDIVVAVLNRGFPQVFSRAQIEQHPWELFGALNAMILANQESAQKGARVRAAWETKKKAAAAVPVSRHCPRWLEWDEAGRAWRVIEERAQIVRDVFEWTASGLGRHAIVKRLNDAAVPVFGHGKKGWETSVIHSWLSGPPVALGVYQPGRVEWGEDGVRRRKTDGEPIEGYYPAIITEDLYRRATASVKSRRTGNGRKGNRFSNLFSGLAWCPVCKGRAAYVDKGKKSKPMLGCENSYRNMCTNKTRFRYDRLERAVLGNVLELDFSQAEPQDHRVAHEAVAVLERKRESLLTSQTNLVAAIESGAAFDALVNRLAKVEAELKATDVGLIEAKGEVARLTSAPAPGDRLTALKAVRDQLADADDASAFLLRSKINASLRDLLAFVALDPDGDVLLVFRHGLGGYCLCRDDTVERSVSMWTPDVLAA